MFNRDLAKKLAFWNISSNKRGQEKQNLSLEIFANFFKKLNLDTNNTGIKEDIIVPSITRQNSDLDKRITEKEILECIDQLKTGKSVGIDCVINEYFKTLKEILMPLYVKLFNIILNTSIIPSDWSFGIIIPINKKGDKANSDNYRGITLLSCFGKLFTSVLHNRLYKFLEQNELLSEVQAGFRKAY